MELEVGAQLLFPAAKKSSPLQIPALPRSSVAAGTPGGAGAAFLSSQRGLQPMISVASQPGLVFLLKLQ